MEHKEIFVDGKDNGYVNDQNWWYKGDNAFRIADLDNDYPEIYFKDDHVSEKVVQAYCNYVQEYFYKIAGRKLDSIIEFGSAGGFFTEEFLKRGFYLVALEGSKAGVLRTKERLKNTKKQVIKHICI